MQKDQEEKETKTGYDSSESEPTQGYVGENIDTSTFWDSNDNLESTTAARGTAEQEILAKAVGGSTRTPFGTAQSNGSSTPATELKTVELSGIELAEQRAEQSYYRSRRGFQSGLSSRPATTGSAGDGKSDSGDEMGGNFAQPMSAQAHPIPRVPTSSPSVKGGDLAKLLDAAVKQTPIPQVRLRDEASYLKWLEGVNNVLSAIGLACLTMMNKYSSFLKNSDKLTELRTGILRGTNNPNLHPKFTKAVKDIKEGFFCDLIPIDEDEYSLNCRYYAMLYVYPNLERLIVTTILPSVDLLIRDSLPDYRSTPDSLKIIYGTVTRRFINENINVIDMREEKVKKLTLGASMDPATLAKQIREEVEVINTASHQVVISSVRQVMLLYNAVKRSPDMEHYRDTLKKYRELKHVRKSTYANFSQELHADYIRDVEQPETLTRGNAAQEGGSNKRYSTPYAPPGYCFDFVKTGSCRDGDDCTYRHEDPAGGKRGSNRLSASRDRRDRRPQSRVDRGNKKDLIRAFVSALLESESDQSDPDPRERSEHDYGSSDGDTSEIALSTGQSKESKKKKKFSKGKDSKDHKRPKQNIVNRRSSNPASSVSVPVQGKRETRTQPAESRNTFQETMKSLEKKYSKIDLAKIAGIFSALDLGEEPNDSVVDDQSTSPGSESQ